MTAGERDGLRVRELVVQYGGLTAVDGVSLHAPYGRITALLGPNGAGKTSTFAACSGLLRPAGGAISLDGEDLGGVPPQARAQRGMGRTFQRMELFDSLPVLQNVSLGCEARAAGSHPLRQLVQPRGQRRQTEDATQAAMHLCGITGLAGRRPADLSTGQRRLVELARVVAGGFGLMLLDEPSSGLDPRETERFGEVLLTLVRERGVGILMVEHDMALVMSICDYGYVLDFGRPIFEGTMPEVAASSEVRAAYLGDETASTGLAS
ncbi:MAG: ABC transporter ATP-binding protein [Mycobacteriales bacterium]